MGTGHQARDHFLNLLRGILSAAGQSSYPIGNNGTTTPLPTGSSRSFNLGIQGQQIGLFSNAVYNIQYRSNFIAVLLQSFNLLFRFFNIQTS